MFDLSRDFHGYLKQSEDLQKCSIFWPHTCRSANKIILVTCYWMHSSKNQERWPDSLVTFQGLKLKKSSGCQMQIFNPQFVWCTPFAVHYEKTRDHLRQTATNSGKIHWLARKYEHLRINHIQLQFLHFNQHSITLLGIHMRHWAYKREKYTFINANIKVIIIILKANRDNWHTLKCKHYSLTFLWHCLQFNSIPGQP